ncbi:MAG: metallophosphatase family protein, partial [Anaerolineales bacterium]|nr:metallophosphatase family protein [Anaerolineales bacterium]
MKIGVLADTHIPDLLPALPARVLEIFSGVDIILHVGDVTDLAVLQQLEPIAQTFAVCGDHDTAQVRHYLEEKQRLSFGGRAVGLVHGHRAWGGNVWRRIAYRLDRTRRSEVLLGYVLRQFNDVDVIVFGHSHAPYMKMHGNTLLFNPGSLLPRMGRVGSIGLLEINATAIKARIVAI